MPNYKVTKKGFYEGKTYHTGEIIRRSKAFTKNAMPSWVKPIKDETASEKKKRIAAEKKAAVAAEKKAAEDKKAVDEVTFDQSSEHKTESL